MDDFIGKIVVVRDHMAGVFVGTLVAFDQNAKTCTLADARHIHYWRKAAAVEGLAARGCHPESRITPAVPLVATCNVVQVVLVPEGEAQHFLLSAPEWRP